MMAQAGQIVRITRTDGEISFRVVVADPLMKYMST
jgi:hypothetical protein